MPGFNAIITASEAQLLQLLRKQTRLRPETDHALYPEQLACAVGFNAHARQAAELPPLLGCAGFDALRRQRDKVFTTDVYRRLALDNVLAIYRAVKDDDALLEEMQGLLGRRLDSIERRIEATVNSLIIDKYKAEIRAVYNEKVIGIACVEARLRRPDDGFRALLNEVGFIIGSKIIPTGDIFFRNTILPQEKRKLLDMGVIPDALVAARLQDPAIPAPEKQVLDDYLRRKRTT